MRHISPPARPASGATRRRFLTASAAAAVLPACVTPPGTEQDPPIPADVEPDAAWSPPGAVDAALFPSGVQVGDVDATSALLAAQSAASGLVLWLTRGRAGVWETPVEIAVADGEDGTVALELTDLNPDTAYSVVLVDGTGRRSAPTRFRTALAASATRVLRFGATSCLGGNLPWATLSHMAAEKLDFFLLNGDTIYADGVPTSGVRALWSTALAVKGMQDLTRSTSIIAAWDDHEVDNNWSWETADIGIRVEACAQELKRHLPMRVGGGDLGIWRKLSWGAAADVFVLDTRGERQGTDYISAEQMGWIKQELQRSTARFKIILNTVPILDLAEVVGTREAQDRWQGYAAQRSELLEHIYGAAPIPGVLWISGDFHLGGIGKIDAVGGPAQNAFEVLAGPGGSPINPALQFLTFSVERFPVLVDTWNATLFEADPATGKVSVRFIGDDGAEIDSLELML